MKGGTWRRVLLRVVVFAPLTVWTAIAYSQTRTADLQTGKDPRGRPEVTICSQNLANYGVPAAMTRRMPDMNASGIREKENALVRRFMEAGCDVIAVQEVLGSDEEEALAGLVKLAKALALATGRTFEATVGASNDQIIRQGVLIARDRAELVNKVSYAHAELPKIAPEQRQRFFARGPLEVQLRVKAQDEGETKTVTLVNFHFKSRSVQAGRDPSGLEWEPYRMEMAEGLRRIVDARQKKALAAGETILVLLGDRNSNFDTATARLLEGVLTLKDFQGTAPCRLSKRGVPLCKAGTAGPQRYFSVLTGDPQTRRLQGTIRFGKVYSWYDDIILPAESLPYAWRESGKSGSYATGVVYLPEKASDHALVWVRLNW